MMLCECWQWPVAKFSQGPMMAPSVYGDIFNGCPAVVRQHRLLAQDIYLAAALTS